MQLITSAGLLPGACGAGTRIRSADAAVLSPGVPIVLVIRPGSRQRTAESRQDV
jgi:hypothetical protein